MSPNTFGLEYLRITTKMEEKNTWVTQVKTNKNIIEQEAHNTTVFHWVFNVKFGRVTFCKGGLTVQIISFGQYLYWSFRWCSYWTLICFCRCPLVRLHQRGKSPNQARLSVLAQSGHPLVPEGLGLALRRCLCRVSRQVCQVCIENAGLGFDVVCFFVGAYSLSPVNWEKRALDIMCFWDVDVRW